MKESGTIALFRYNMIAGDGDELYEEIQTKLEKYYYSHYTSNIRPIKKTKEDFEKPSEIFWGFRFEDLRAYGFKDIEMKFYDVQKVYSADEYIALLDTLSDYRALPNDNRLLLYEEIKQVILRHSNEYKVDYVFQLYMGRKY